MEFTNEILEKATGKTIFQIKRWAVAFLGSDPSMGQHSGISRKYTLEQSFIIVLGGHLVDDLDFSMEEAKKIVEDIICWMRRKGWIISKLVEFSQPHRNGQFVANFPFPQAGLIIEIEGLRDVPHQVNYRFSYYLKIIHEKKSMQRRNFWREKYELHNFGENSQNPLVCSRSLNIGEMIKALANKLAIYMK